MNNTQHPTTSQELADKLLALLQDHGGFRLVEVLHPTPGLTSLGANSALVIMTQDGTRFGLECTPFPTLRHDAVRQMTPADREKYGCTHPEDEPCHGRRTATVREADAATEGA